MNWAGVQKLPVIFVLENNQYAYSTPLDQQFAVDPVERAAAYGFPGVTVDGNDAEAMFEATRAARERALAGEGPTLIEAVTMRMHGHAAHDDMKYVPRSRSRSGSAKDPIDRQARRLRELGVDVDASAPRSAPRSTRPTRRRWRCRCPTRRRPPTACSPSEAAPARDGAAPGAASRRARRLMPALTYLQAISDGMRNEMREDERRRRRLGPSALARRSTLFGGLPASSR